MAAKIFEVGDVLPATTQLKISWSNLTNNSDFISPVIIKTSNGNFYLFDEKEEFSPFCPFPPPAPTLIL